MLKESTHNGKRVVLLLVNEGLGLGLYYKPRDRKRPKTKNWYILYHYIVGGIGPSAIALSYREFRAICYHGAKNPMVEVPNFSACKSVTCNLGYEHIIKPKPPEDIDDQSLCVRIHCDGGSSLQITWPLLTELVQNGLEAQRLARSFYPPCRR